MLEAMTSSDQLKGSWPPMTHHYHSPFYSPFPLFFNPFSHPVYPPPGPLYLSHTPPLPLADITQPYGESSGAVHRYLPPGPCPYEADISPSGGICDSKASTSKTSRKADCALESYSNQYASLLTDSKGEGSRSHEYDHGGGGGGGGGGEEPSFALNLSSSGRGSAVPREEALAEPKPIKNEPARKMIRPGPGPAPFDPIQLLNIYYPSGTGCNLCGTSGAETSCEHSFLDTRLNPYIPTLMPNPLGWIGTRYNPYQSSLAPSSPPFDFANPLGIKQEAQTPAVPPPDESSIVVNKKDEPETPPPEPIIESPEPEIEEPKVEETSSPKTMENWLLVPPKVKFESVPRLLSPAMDVTGLEILSRGVEKAENHPLTGLSLLCALAEERIKDLDAPEESVPDSAPPLLTRADVPVWTTEERALPPTLSPKVSELRPECNGLARPQDEPYDLTVRTNEGDMKSHDQRSPKERSRKRSSRLSSNSKLKTRKRRDESQRCSLRLLDKKRSYIKVEECEEERCRESASPFQIVGPELVEEKNPEVVREGNKYQGKIILKLRRERLSKPGECDSKSSILTTEVLMKSSFPMKILTKDGGLFYTGQLSAIRPPDVYGITIDGERGNRPHIYSREEVLDNSILEVKPVSKAELKPGTRICAYWSEQCRCLYPGSISPSAIVDPDPGSVNVEFDDGDSCRISINDIRLLPENYPIVEYDPNPLISITKRRRRAKTEPALKEEKVTGGAVVAEEAGNGAGERKSHRSRTEERMKRHKHKHHRRKHHSKESSPGSVQSGRKKRSKRRKEETQVQPIPIFRPWRWSGKGFRRPGVKGKARKEYYRAIQRGDERIGIGECAVFLSTGRPDRPFIGRIESMWQTWGANMVVRVKWFYHPEETVGCPAVLEYPGALFESPHSDENDVQTISHKCEVLPLSNYIERRGKAARKHNGSTKLYYLAGLYDPTNTSLQFKEGVL